MSKEPLVYHSKEVTCSGCGTVFDGREGLGYNVGFGPQYFCLKCSPPATAEEVIADMKWFMEFTREESD